MAMVAKKWVNFDVLYLNLVNVEEESFVFRFAYEIRGPNRPNARPIYLDIDLVNSMISGSYSSIHTIFTIRYCAR